MKLDMTTSRGSMWMHLSSNPSKETLTERQNDVDGLYLYYAAALSIW